MRHKKQTLRENNFDTARAGSAGAMGYAAGYGTPASPNVRQDPASFVGSKTLGPNSNTSAGKDASNSQYDAAVDQLFKGKNTPSPDEVLTGLKYELQNMIKKDKGLAKQLVLNNLKQDPHYYGKLRMLNIDDKEMMNVKPQNNSAEDQLNERIKILNQMLASKTKKPETPQSIKDALKETREKRNQRYQR